MDFLVLVNLLIFGDFFEYFPVDHIVKLEVTDESTLGYPYGCIFYSGGIVVFDKPNAHPVLFDHRGKFLKSIGEFGPGPFEFKNIAGLEPCWGGDYFAISDRIQLKLVVFDKNGDPVYQLIVST